ncbi:hypothetical protein RJ640_029492 [Escallonia rubra]|uniref:NADP-dependent oxidoreductase domain-containing protein n=1 Tax=Escallonia rubra TaxID=112253 RepID=A0AA88S1I7_9ASTE|nr:hypothetical protein RJ640_029492 [Escallonia rubra]
MAPYTIPEVSLTSPNHKMPVLGLGTAHYPLVGSEAVKKAVLEAIELGYRHFDTAFLYQTEQPLGEAIAEALRLSLIKSRASFKPGTYGFPPKPEDLIPIDMKAVWTAMEECQTLGLTKSIGVSNFSCKKLGDILAFAKIPPAVEMNPLWQQKKLIKFCKDNGIAVAAHSPLRAVGAAGCEVLKEIAEAKGKSVAQVCLRWAYEQGVGAILVKSFRKDRMKENLEIFECGLSPEESKKIGEAIPQSRGNRGEFFVSADGPIKSVEELWDGEL